MNIKESKKNKKDFKKLDFEDFVVYLGKSANGNDYITFELSNDRDLWFHARGVPGSHVLLKVNEKLPDNDVIKFCSGLAAQNSKAPEGEIEVVYCKIKYVSKKENMNPGQVQVDYKNSETIKVLKK